MSYTPYQDEDITLEPSEERYNLIDRAIDKTKVEDDVPDLTGLWDDSVLPDYCLD